MRKIKSILFLLGVLTLTSVWAEETAEPVKTSSNQKVEYDQGKFKMIFEDELVQGGVSKPDLVNLATKPHVKFKKLIKIREDFSDEMNNARFEFSEKN